MKVDDNMKKIEAIAGESWVPVLYMLEEARDRGEDAYAEINGYTFYSKGFDIDDAYKTLTGFDRPRDGRSVAKDLESWVERGKKLIYPERFEEWISFIIAQSKKESGYGRNIGRVLDLMEMLDKGATKEEVNKAMDNMYLSGGEYFFFCRAILYFSKRGPEFVNLQPGHRDFSYYLQVISENEKFAEAERKRKEEVPTGGVPGK